MYGHARIGALVVAGLVSLSAASEAAAQQQFNWRGQVAQGRTVEIKGVNGAIRAVAASGNEVRVTATKTARRSDPAEVQIEVIPHGDGVTLCALYPSPRGRPDNECRPGRGGRMNVQNNDVSVEFVVEVPAGVNFVARTVNGAIDGNRLTGNVEAHTVNGNVRLTTAGAAEANTVNGSIEVVIGRSDWRDALNFETVNGSISVTVSGDLNSHVQASTVNGSINTDFPLTVQGRFGPRSINGTIGTGGRTLQLKTVNGTIHLRRG